jgi:hypothetical protein
LPFIRPCQSSDFAFAPSPKNTPAGSAGVFRTGDAQRLALLGV